MKAGESGVTKYEFQGAAKQAGFAPVALAGWSVGANQQFDEIMAPLQDIRQGIFIYGGLSPLSGLAGIFFAARRISRPIMRVVAGVDQSADQVPAATPRRSPQPPKAWPTAPASRPHP